MIGEIGPAEPGRLFLGHDPVLKRDVWVHELPPGTPALSQRRRQVARPCRLRWLAGVRTRTAAWDAYEAPDGAALSRVVEVRQPWDLVREWLSPLVEEMESGLADGTLTGLSLDRVWMTRRGGPRLLDFPMGQLQEEQFALNVQGAQRCLFGITAAALMGRVNATSVERPLPLPARTALKRLEAAEFATLAQVRAVLEDLLARPDSVTRRRRRPACFPRFPCSSSWWLAASHCK